MGAILDTPAALPFSVEARTESATISTGIETPVMHGRLHEPWHAERQPGGVLYLPVGRLGPFRAAAAAALVQPAAHDAAACGDWTITRQDEELVIEGPAWLYGLMEAGTERAPVTAVEVGYGELRKLLTQLDATSA